MRRTSMLDAKVFDFPAFHADVTAWCSENDMSLSSFCTRKLMRGETYVSTSVTKKRIPLDVARGICEIIGQPPAKYEINKKGPEKPAVVAPVADGAEWSCKLAVNVEFGIVSFILLHNGEEYAKAHAKINGDGTDTDIAKSISYAAHMCYKNCEQTDFVNRIAASDSEALGMNPFSKANVPFKDYIRVFADELTERGAIARFVKNHYAAVPTWGEKSIKHYLMSQNAPEKVLSGFDAEFKNYREWAKK